MVKLKRPNLCDNTSDDRTASKSRRASFKLHEESLDKHQKLERLKKLQDQDFDFQLSVPKGRKRVMSFNL